MNSNDILVQCVIVVLAITTISSNYGENKSKLFVDAYAGTKYVKYHVAVINGLSNDILDVHCKGDDEDLHLQHLAVNTNFTWSLRTAFFYKVSYDCTVHWEEGGEIKFNAFIDDSKFLDYGCGGRHCFWKTTDFGLYLWQIHNRTFVYKYGWPGKQILRVDNIYVMV
ncbi:S-protein homolog 1-like [Spinacia oleracea]|uniref:S-protein homolog n=1 Tax=Spinacia oleracea TaxID=3562 RepID=A0ABM3R4Y7_SPIOL|nr:S-protein homolog 1-like [Spinacia oleracea]